LPDDWDLLNRQTGGPHDTGENEPATSADDPLSGHCCVIPCRAVEDMRIRGMGDKVQKAHISALKDFTRFIDRSPNTATPDNLRAYQLHMTEKGVTPSTYNARVIALRFFFGMTCGREEMKRYMQF
jgi:hypothetical protein